MTGQRDLGQRPGRWGSCDLEDHQGAARELRDQAALMLLVTFVLDDDRDLATVGGHGDGVRLPR